MQAKIGDFGFAMQIPDRTGGKSFIHTSVLRGTPGYVAPEFLLWEMGPKCDEFSSGVVRQVNFLLVTLDHGICTSVVGPRDV